MPELTCSCGEKINVEYTNPFIILLILSTHLRQRHNFENPRITSVNNNKIIIRDKNAPSRTLNLKITN